MLTSISLQSILQSLVTYPRIWQEILFDVLVRDLLQKYAKAETMLHITKYKILDRFHVNLTFRNNVAFFQSCFDNILQHWETKTESSVNNSETVMPSYAVFHLCNPSQLVILLLQVETIFFYFIVKGDHSCIMTDSN